MTNQIYSKRNLFWSRLISSFLHPYYTFFNLFRKKYDLKNIEVKNILVTEYHRIGDILMIAKTLKSIKKSFPSSRLILLCSKQAQLLAEHLNLADEIYSIKVPWTDWNWSILRWIRVRTFAQQIAKKKIDLAFDFKGDLRNSWFLWHIKAKISFGYTTTGGEYFFTHGEEMNQDIHQTLRANNLILKAGCKIMIDGQTKHKLNNNGSIVFHNGATDPRRSWPVNHWVKLAKSLSERYKVTIVKTPESLALIKQLKDSELQVDIFEGGLVDFKLWLQEQQCLISPDSMAGHLAAYLHIPTISLFGAQNPELTRPLNKMGAIVTSDSQCNHKINHWRLCRACMESIDPEKVSKTVFRLLSQMTIHE
ncbi:MAG: hypothetical protein CL730_05050 [Chloroflexi bacterium]|nr:hypothetical protein [Chloroflexota bacterium]